MTGQRHEVRQLRSERQEGGHVVLWEVWDLAAAALVSVHRSKTEANRLAYDLNADEREYRKFLEASR